MHLSFPCTQKTQSPLASGKHPSPKTYKKVVFLRNSLKSQKTNRKKQPMIKSQTTHALMQKYLFSHLTLANTDKHRFFNAKLRIYLL